MLLWEERFLVLLQPVFGERLLGTFPLGMSSVTWDTFLIYEVLKDHSGVFWLYFSCSFMSLLIGHILCPRAKTLQMRS